MNNRQWKIHVILNHLELLKNEYKRIDEGIAERVISAVKEILEGLNEAEEKGAFD